MANVAKDDVNVKKMYGQECILPKDEFIKEYNIKEKRSFF